MQINPNTPNLTQQAYSKSSDANTASKNKEMQKNTDEAVNLSIDSSKEPLNSGDIDFIQERGQELEKQLNVDFAKESSNFSKTNITSQEGSFLSSQASNIQESAVRLLS